jgi:hypothetical protein
MTHQRQLSSYITLIQLISVVDLDNIIQHKIKQSVWSLDAAHLFPSAIWNVHDAIVNGDARTNHMFEDTVRGLEQQVLQPSRTCPSVYMACDRVVSKGRSYCLYCLVIHQLSVFNRHVQLQERSQSVCRDLTTGQKTIAEFLCGVGWNIRLNHQH